MEDLHVSGNRRGDTTVEHVTDIWQNKDWLRLWTLAEGLVASVGRGAADLEIGQVSSMPTLAILPHRRGAARVSLVMLDDELSGTIGRGAFYFAWGDDEDASELETLLGLTLLGRVEERWSLGCRLRVRPLVGRPYTFGQFSPVPWWISVPRRFDAFDPAVEDRGEAMRRCPDCGHDWAEHPRAPGLPPADDECSECRFEVDHEQRGPTTGDPCRLHAQERPWDR